MSSVPDDPRVLQFVCHARDYCRLIESFADGKPPALYAQLLSFLSNLAASGVAIPFDMPETELKDDLRMTHQAWSAVAKTISVAVHDEVSALIEHHAADDDELPRLAMFWDDLADIYRDLKHGLRLFEIGTPNGRSEAIWEWRFGYENHWGTHLMRALATAHEIRHFLRAE
jgi:hypothetical protein